MAKGRPKGSKSTTPVRISDLKAFLPENGVVQVGTTWLRKFEELYNVKFSSPESPVQSVAPVPEVLESASEKEAEVRERLNVKPETL